MTVKKLDSLVGELGTLLETLDFYRWGKSDRPNDRYFTSNRDLALIIRKTLQERGAYVYPSLKLPSMKLVTCTVIPFRWRDQLCALKVSFFPLHPIHEDEGIYQPQGRGTWLYPEEFTYLSDQRTLWLLVTEPPDTVLHQYSLEPPGEERAACKEFLTSIRQKVVRNEIPYEVLLLDHAPILQVIEEYVLKKLQVRKRPSAFRVHFKDIAQLVSQKYTFLLQEFQRGDVATFILRQFQQLNPDICVLDSLIQNIPTVAAPPAKKQAVLDTTILSTLGYHPEAVVAAANTFKGQELWLLHDFSEGGPVKVTPILDKIRQTLPMRLNVCDTSKMRLEPLLHYIYQFIEEKSEANYHIILSLSGGSQRLTLALILASYFYYNKINRLLFYEEDAHSPIELPLLPSPFADPIPPPIEKNNQQGERLIATIGYHPEPILNAVKQFRRKKVLLLHTLPEEVIGPLVEEMRGIVPKARFHPHSLQSLGIYDAISRVSTLIQKETHYKRTLLQFAGGSQKLTTVLMFAGFLCHERVRHLFYYPPKESTPTYLPRLSWNTKEVEGLGGDPLRNLVKRKGKFF